MAADPWANLKQFTDARIGLGRSGSAMPTHEVLNFALSHEVQAVELAGEVSRIFLGVQIQCAQCHDHPNDSWKRQQFHEFAAYFAGLRRKQTNGPPRITEVLAQPRARYTMPDKQDPQKQIFVAPKFFLGNVWLGPAARTGVLRPKHGSAI